MRGSGAVLRANTGTGLDFSAASAVVFAELPAEVAAVRQAEDRAHRHGQRRPVNVYFLLARGTLDERRSAVAVSSLAAWPTPYYLKALLIYLVGFQRVSWRCSLRKLAFRCCNCICLCRGYCQGSENLR